MAPLTQDRRTDDYRPYVDRMAPSDSDHVVDPDSMSGTFAALRAAQHNLSVVVEMLENRLHAVLRSDAKLVGIEPDEPSEEVDYRSPLTIQLAQFTEALQVETERLRQLAARVDL